MISLNDSFINFAIFLKEARKSEMTTEQNDVVDQIEELVSVQLRSATYLLKSFSCSYKSTNIALSDHLELQYAILLNAL